VFASPVPTFGELIGHAKRVYGMRGVRTTRHEAARPVRMVGNAWGGPALFVNMACVQSLIDLGADAIICGDTDNWALRLIEESGLAAVEASHELTEDAGLARFAAMLGRELGIPVQHVATPPVWEMR